ncbi:hypothetical protein ACTJJ0_25445 [Chitinophaga sp. 22321]|uniref:VCBS repeat-containing protein n=1 Tax=Chitinophaga hostae TaxID=2831022 RepID=A0ABS5J7B9_9BACT|nr:hypothetical protein [Chitinophaga hostae]MBS0030467.1 hypothetical protein [Chitinophaga hostae]
MKHLYPLLLAYSCLVMSCGQPHAVNDPGNGKVALARRVQPAPEMGNRFVLEGDFDGDGRKDTLTEHFVDLLTRQETNKYYHDVDYDQQVRLNAARSVMSFVNSNNEMLDTLYISGGLSFGLSWIKNEGDLNGDGTDEISYVVSLADWSALNHCTLVTYRNHHWEELYRFSVWDWQLPDPPALNNEYGFFGNTAQYIDSSSSSPGFPGFIKKVAPGKIRVWFENEGLQDSAIVDLRL